MATHMIPPETLLPPPTVSTTSPRPQFVVYAFPLPVKLREVSCIRYSLQTVSVGLFRPSIVPGGGGGVRLHRKTKQNTLDTLHKDIFLAFTNATPPHRKYHKIRLHTSCRGFPLSKNLRSQYAISLSQRPRRVSSAWRFGYS